MLVAINAINHAPVIHNTVMGEPISPNIKITATNEKYEIACDFIIKKSSFVIPTPPSCLCTALANADNNVINSCGIKNAMFVLGFHICSYKTFKPHSCFA